ncbi:hypothetical protein B0H11DRAFT_2258567 [Mycena galericulata]|nr:hypothetical protein B0H11DRAFT_2258567 [Mycena galericulata]
MVEKIENVSKRKKKTAAPYVPQRAVIARLLKNKHVKRIAGFQSSAFADWAPKVYEDYAESLKQLFEKYPGLEHNFENSIFPAATFNCSPDSISFMHTDYNNLPSGWCSITAGGQFNAEESALLYIKQFKVMVEFPSGASGFILSGSVDHGNTPLAAGEMRYSMTQYCAGGLFRWVKYGFKSAKALLAQTGGKVLREAYDGVPGSRWQSALDLFSKLDEIAIDRQKLPERPVHLLNFKMNANQALWRAHIDRLNRMCEDPVKGPELKRRLSLLKGKAAQDFRLLLVERRRIIEVLETAGGDELKETEVLPQPPVGFVYVVEEDATKRPQHHPPPVELAAASGRKRPRDDDLDWEGQQKREHMAFKRTRTDSDQSEQPRQPPLSVHLERAQGAGVVAAAGGGRISYLQRRHNQQLAWKAAVAEIIDTQLTM